MVLPSFLLSLITNSGVKASNDVRWERFPQIDIGGDMALFQNRINLAVDWYQKDANDKYFYNIPAQTTTGYAYYSGNYVNVRNRGLEISVNTKNLGQRSKFQWNTDFNISFNSNYGFHFWATMVSANAYYR
jgi:hypothetical protein